jgi:hypothetical protein
MSPRIARFLLSTTFLLNLLVSCAVIAGFLLHSELLSRYLIVVALASPLLYLALVYPSVAASEYARLMVGRMRAFDERETAIRARLMRTVGIWFFWGAVCWVGILAFAQYQSLFLPPLFDVQFMDSWYILLILLGVGVYPLCLLAGSLVWIIPLMADMSTVIPEQYRRVSWQVRVSQVAFSLIVVLTLIGGTFAADWYNEMKVVSRTFDISAPIDRIETAGEVETHVETVFGTAVHIVATGHRHLIESMEMTQTVSSDGRHTLRIYADTHSPTLGIDKKVQLKIQAPTGVVVH